MSSLLRHIKSALCARASRAHADADADAEAEAADQNNFVNNSQANDNGQSPPPVPPKNKSKSSIVFQHPLSSPHHQRRAAIDLSAAVESRSNIQTRANQTERRSSVTDFRRRLVRKASTLNLHTRRLAGVSRAASEHRNPSLFLSISTTDSDTPATTAIQRLRSAPVSVPTRPVTASTAESEATDATVHLPNSPNTTRSGSILSTVTDISADDSDLEKEVQNNGEPDAISAAQSINSIERDIDPLGPEQNEHKMATTTPLPYETLKKITVEACETALSNVTAYDHPKTESWNTTIINTILAQLVGETSDSSDSTASAPKYKFVVNSTIVQHRNSMSEHGGGRRGMHSAAGAYWNNEKDGMWSFKYDAGDSKGLDVVVGIVWVWVG